MKSPPTDRRLLKQIYTEYFNTFVQFSEEDKTRATKIYVPIDIEKIAKKFDTDPDLIFGRLYYHLNKKYGYTQEDGSKVHLFAMAVGGDRHSIHFPLLTSILASLEGENRKFLVATGISVIALCLSIFSLVI